MLVEARSREEREEFRGKLKEEWVRMWKERFDDKVKAEGIVVKDYPLLFVDRGIVIFASRDAKTPSFSEVVSYWASKGMVYSPDPVEGGWGKFIRTTLKDPRNSRARALAEICEEPRVIRQQLKKSGRGWLHK
jgi:hypothetical protein